MKILIRAINIKIKEAKKSFLFWKSIKDYSNMADFDAYIKGLKVAREIILCHIKQQKGGK